MKIDLPKRNIVFQAGNFRAYLTFMECIFHVLLLIFVYRKLTLCGQGKKSDVTLLLLFTLFIPVPIVNPSIFFHPVQKQQNPCCVWPQISCLTGSPLGWFCFTSSNGGEFHWRAFQVDSSNLMIQHITRWMKKTIRQPATRRVKVLQRGHFHPMDNKFSYMDEAARLGYIDHE